jgi:alkanesulfonate monooxygenase SsuD/methylene tetrahydromethanopterin reductase-like flavin-dependent oxidoreductase (luciferase family)
MRAAWSSAVPEFHGEFFNLEGMRFGPRPAAGNIPIWVGGISRRAIRRAVELGDGWHGTRMNPDQVAERIGWIRELAARRGRNLDGFAISHRVYLGFAPKWTDTGGYVEGILAPPSRNRRLPEPLRRNRRQRNPDKPNRHRPARKVPRPLRRRSPPQARVSAVTPCVIQTEASIASTSVTLT